MNKTKISIFGLGYVGCVSLGCLSNEGFDVIGVDVSQSKIDLINKGLPTIIEKDIGNLIDSAYKNGRISATSDYIKAVNKSNISIISVGTPSTKKGHLNLDYIYNVSKEIGEALKEKNDFHTIIIRSTVFPGTNNKVGELIEKSSGKRRNIHFAVVSNPEFLREGSAVKDYYNPSVTVIGSDNEKALEIVTNIYSSIDAPIEKVDVKVAEMIKYVNNSFHALKISFANEIGNICKELEISPQSVMNLFTMDTKLNLSAYYLNPGFSYGGSCLPKDLKGLRTMSHDLYLSSPIVESIDESNNNQKMKAIDIIESKRKKKIGILGLSFKPGTDDLRYSPIVEVSEYLLGKGYEILIYDENVNYSRLTGTNRIYIESHIPHIAKYLNDDINKVITSSDLLVITHDFEDIEFYIEKYRDKQFVDLSKERTNMGNNYEGICW
ncbi:MAG: nucleotide sugar dehydrogenase [Bacteroidales bacterium]|nr:nucleotide sugar dehydrogenase [Bacteroidales bacterium]